MERDFLDEVIAKRTRSNPEFPATLEAARAGRAELKAKLEPTGEERVDEILSHRSNGSSRRLTKQPDDHAPVGPRCLRNYGVQIRGPISQQPRRTK